MYDELVKRLREEANSWCINCCYRAGNCICAAPDDRKKDCDICSKLQAADAIKELSHDYEKLAEDFNGAVELLHKREKPRWIPVTERLPEPEEDVLVLFPHNKAVAYMLDDGRWQVNSGDGWSTNIDLEGGEKGPTHWMPLPSTEGLNEA